ncbi:MAG: Cpe/LpqF family protein [Thermomicrobiales bacterium]
MSSFLMRFRLTMLHAFVAALAMTLIGASAVVAQTPVATPEASPVAGGQLPDGPLGEQIQWLVNLLNGDPAEITGDEIEAHLTPAFLDAAPAEEIVEGLLQVAGSRPFAIDDDLIITTMDLPATNGRFVLVGNDAMRIGVSLQIDRDTGLIAGLMLELASDATPEATPAA